MHQTIGKWAIATGCVAALLVTAGCASETKTGQPRQSPIWADSDQLTEADVSSQAEPRILPRTHYAAGRLLEKRGDFEGAVSQYRRSVALNHRYLEAWNRLGVVLDRLGRFEEADQAFTQAIFIDPDQPHLRNNLAFSYMLQRRWSDAEAELRNALLLNPDFTRARVNLGLVLAYQQRFDDALAVFTQALPEADAHYNVGLIRRQMGHHAEAVRSFKKALLLDPRLEAATQQIAGIEQAFGKMELDEAVLADASHERAIGPMGWVPAARIAAFGAAIEARETGPDPSPSAKDEADAPFDGLWEAVPAAPEECWGQEEQEEAEFATAPVPPDTPDEALANRLEPATRGGQFHAGATISAPPEADPAAEPATISVPQEAADLSAYVPEGAPWSGWTLAARTARSEWTEPPTIEPAGAEPVAFPEVFPFSDFVTSTTDAPAPDRVELPSEEPARPVRPGETLELAMVLDEATMSRPSLFAPFEAMPRFAFSRPAVADIQTIAVEDEPSVAPLELEWLMDRAAETYRLLKEALIESLTKWGPTQNVFSPDDRQAQVIWPRNPAP